MAGPNTQLENIPHTLGSYALMLRIDNAVQLSVGRLGALNFLPGPYFYLGSALGPGGLRARLRHHFMDDAKAHWHIDSLRAVSHLQSGWYCAAPLRMECAWSQALAALPGARIPAPGFGATDCKWGCRSHLIAFPERFEEAAVEAALRAAIPDGDVHLLVRF